MVGRRAMRVAVLAGALATLVGEIPDLVMREQIVDIAAMLEAEADALVAEIEFSDELLTVGGRAA